MTKYKVGDKVRIVSERGSRWSSQMVKYSGKVMTIRIANDSFYKLEEDKHEHENGWFWQEEDFAEKVETDPCKIINGKVKCISVDKPDTKFFTLGKIYEVERSNLKSNTKFEFKPCGFRNAVEWMHNRTKTRFEVVFDDVPETPEESPKTKFKVGDMVIGNSKANKYGVTVEGWKGEVEEVKPSGVLTISGFHGLDPECFDLLGEAPKKKPEEPEKREFKVGDRVKAVKPVGNAEVVNVYGKIIHVDKDFGQNSLVEFDEDIHGHYGEGEHKGKDGHCWWCWDDDIVLIKEESKYYNGKIMCVDTCGRNLNLYTVGKIYEVVDGYFVANNGMKMPCDGKPIKTFADWERFTSSKFKEVKDEEPPRKLNLYNGKVVCVANRYKDFFPISHFTVGKVYNVTDGVIIRDNGVPGLIPCLNLDMLCSVYGNTFVPLQT